MRKAPVFSVSLRILLSAFWLVSLILPLIIMFSQITLVDLQKLFSAKTTVPAIIRSLFSASVSTLLSVGLGGLLAFFTARVGVRGRTVFSIIFTLPMLIPSLSHGMGLVILLGKNGLLTNLLHINFDIYGLLGIVMGSVMYSFPVAYIMLSDLFKYEDSTPFEAAQVLGLNKLNKLTAISLPYLRKPLISILFAVFTMIVTDYGVPLMVGGKYRTLPVIMYEDVLGLLQFGKGSAIGLMLLIAAVISFLFDLFNKDRASSSYALKPFGTNRQKGMHAAGFALCLMACAWVLLPIVSFVMTAFTQKYPTDMTFTFAHILRTMDMNAGKYLLNSIIIALGVSVFGTAFAFVTAYITVRMPSKFSRLMHLTSIASLAVPGLVLGLSYALFFRGSFLYGTFAILIMVNSVHFFASPYLMVYNTLGKINENLEIVGQTLGVSRFCIIKDVIIPQTKRTMFEMFSTFFVNAMMTISAVSFLFNINIKPISLMINQFEAQAMLESAAVVSLMILIINLMMKGLSLFFKKHIA